MKADPRNHPLTEFLDLSPEYLAADPVEVFRICNGCGSAQAKFDFVPDSIYGMDISPACYAHDWDYHHGKTTDDKRRADMRMLNNLLTLIQMQSANGFMRYIRNRRAFKYYDAVCIGGNRAFFAGKPLLPKA